MVSPKNRIERFFFAEVSLDFQDQFEDFNFIDESTVQMNKNANTFWFKVISGETRLVLIGKYKHAASVQIWWTFEERTNSVGYFLKALSIQTSFNN